MKQLADQGRIISIDKVKNEIYDKNDALEAWCKANLHDHFFKESNEIMAAYEKVISWAISRSSHYMPNALNEFLDADEADAYIVAYTLSDFVNRVVVTQERSDPKRKNKVKIPEACNALNVEFVNTMDMFRKLGETF